MSRVTRSGSGEMRWIVSVSPRATIPLTWAASPASYAFAPTTSSRKPKVGTDPFSFGLRLRSIEYLNVSAVTGWFEGGEKRKPLRISKVYERPSADRVGSAWATSGISREPSGAGRSG